MLTLQTSATEENLAAILTLLSMGIKSVSIPVLRKAFPQCVKAFLEVLEKNEGTEDGALLRSIIGCLSVLLRAQNYASWSEPSTMRAFELVLAFALHSKPKVCILYAYITFTAYHVYIEIK